MKRRSIPSAIFVTTVLAAMNVATRADTITVDGFAYDGTVNGLRNGRVSLTIKGGTEKLFDVAQVIAIELDAVPKMTEAEASRADAKKSVALYKQAIAAINKPELRQLAELRAIEPTEKDGRWSEALILFLDVYQAIPTEAVWKLRPTKMPEAGSKMLTDGAQRVSDAVKSAKADDAKKNLKTYLVEIYLKAGDADAAGRLAKEITTGIAEDPQLTRAAANVTTAADDLYNKKDYAGAIKTAADLLAKGQSPEAAVRLFAVQALSYEALNKADDAAAAWLRIPAHYPSSAAAATALLRAAEIQKSLNRPEAVAALQKEILTAYPESKEAASLKK